MTGTGVGGRGSAEWISGHILGQATQALRAMKVGLKFTAAGNEMV